jgi:hydroxyacylglutathione hydrolase
MKTLAFNAFQENTVLWPMAPGRVLVIDPGMSNPEEWAKFERALEELDAEPGAVLLTHGHLDHVMGCAGMLERYGLSPRIHPLDRPTYDMALPAAQMYGVDLDLPPPPIEDLEVGATLKWDDCALEVRLTPGHAAGHVVFVDHQRGHVINGDVLFSGSVGRTDLPGGDAPTLVRSIVEELYSLPDHYVVLCGHGPSTTIGAERAANPMVNGAGTGWMQQQ